MRATMPSTKAGSKPARRAVGSQKPSILGNPPMTARLGQPSLISRSRIFLRCSRDGCMPEIVLEKIGLSDIRELDPFDALYPSTLVPHYVERVDVTAYGNAAGVEVVGEPFARLGIGRIPDCHVWDEGDIQPQFCRKGAGV